MISVIGMTDENVLNAIDFILESRSAIFAAIKENTTWLMVTPRGIDADGVNGNIIFKVHGIK